MKNRLVLLMTAMIIACSGSAMAVNAETDAAAEPASGQGLQKDLMILFTSDVHSGVDQGFGYAGLEAVKDAYEEAGDYVLLIDNGDSVQGEALGLLTQGEADIKLMNDMGYEIAIPGNHEFDYGMDRFFEFVEMADFPYISCNFRKNGELVFDPYIIKEYDGVQIAFVGVTTPETLTSSSPRYFQDEEGNFIYSFSQGGNGEEFYETIQTAVDDARAEGADYVIVMGHLGNEAFLEPYTYADVVSNTNGIDIFLDGHSHDTDHVDMQNKDGVVIPRQACGTKMQGIGWVRINAEDGSLENGLYTWNNSVPAPELLGIKNEMRDKVAEATGAINEQLSEVVGKTPVELTIYDPEATKDDGSRVRIIRQAETNLGDFCADACRDAMGADAAILVAGGIHGGIEAGEVTLGDMLNPFAYGNKVCMIEATGQQILDALEFGTKGLPDECNPFMQVSNITYEIHMYVDSHVTVDANGQFTGVDGEYRVKNVTIGGEPLDLEKTYTLAGLNYTLTDTGDGLTAFNGCTLLKRSDEMDYEILAQYLSGTLGGVVGEEYSDPYGQGRIVAVEEAPAAN